MRIALFGAVLVCSVGISVSAQQLENDRFQLKFSSSGLSSLKHTRDVYDTDYVLPGRALGDVVVRYRTAGQAWKQADSATAGAATPSSQGTAYTYQIGRAIPTVATASKTSSSIGPWGTNALNDQIEPKSSRDQGVPFFAWGDHHGSEEWVQYDFHATAQVSSTEVYWAIGSYEDYQWGLPLSWKVQYRDGEQWKDVRISGTYSVVPDQFNHVDFEPVVTQHLRLLAQLPKQATSAIYEWRVNATNGKQVESVADVAPTESFRLDRDSLLWTITLRNETEQAIEIGDLGFALPFNTDYVSDKTETYTKRVIRHSFIGGNGSYLFWMRCNAVGPYLLMVPEKGTHLEYFDLEEDRSYTAYVHSWERGEELATKGGTWRLRHTKVTLEPNGSSGDSLIYRFKFRWAKDYAAVRELLYQEGGFDVNVVPGMTVPTDLPTMFSLRTRNQIRAITAEHPENTSIKLIARKSPDTYLYSVRFSRLGENMLTVKYGRGEYLPLDFFVTEPLETLYKKRARFLVTHEQWHDPKRWYHSLYSQWDMKHQVLRSPDDLDGLQSYAVASDDPALGKAPYLAYENVFFPDQEEITSVEDYVHDFVWGGLQQTDKEPYPYAIYGIPNWNANRHSSQDNEHGKRHLWRIYDYPHIVALYYYLYLVAHNYPGMVHYLDAAGYLERAYGTAIAFFTVPMEIVKWSAYETGTYNEVVIPDLIRALEENGRKDQAEKLREHWEKKAEFFINKNPDLYQSEYPFDSTAFESTHALAVYAQTRLQNPSATKFRESIQASAARDFLEEQMRLNIAARGWEPAYYWLGSDYRASGNTQYTLSYMSQMGGWAIENYAIDFAKDPIPYLRLGYQSYLASWALLNSGTPESNYGYWFPGKENDGGAGGGFEPRPWGRAWLGNKEMGRGSWWYSGEIDLGFTGALRAAATIVSDDPIFGLYAYGGVLKHSGKSISVIPRDGLRSRFALVRGETRFQLSLSRDGFAKEEPISIDDSLDRITFRLENRSHDQHETALNIRGLPAGFYRLSMGHKFTKKFASEAGVALRLNILVPSDEANLVSIERD